MNNTTEMAEIVTFLLSYEKICLPLKVNALFATS